MSKSRVSYAALKLAFTAPTSNYENWLDKQTGEVLSFDRSIADALAEGCGLAHLPQWQQHELESARRVLQAFGELPGEAEDPRALERYVHIPVIETGEAYETMVDFVETVRDGHLRELLEVALRGQGAFRRFKDVLLNYPAEQERWFEFESQRERATITAWAREEGVEVAFDH
jgi:hypothetical protein